jgi:hypothetical protein
LSTKPAVASAIRSHWWRRYDPQRVDSIF